MSRLHAVRAPVRAVSPGLAWHGGRLVPVQVAVSGIPADVDGMLADARPAPAQGAGAWGGVFPLA